MNRILRPPLPHMTADDFLAWPGDGSGRKFQLVDGVLHVMSPASSVHGVIQARLAHLLWGAIETAGLALSVIVEGAVIPGIYSSTNVRVLDVVVTASRAERGEIAVLEPVLLIEVLSPGNQDDTRDNIRSYATLQSVQEILVVHSTRALIELHRRDVNGAWPPEPEYLGPGQRIVLASAGLDCVVEEVFRGTWLQA